MIKVQSTLFILFGIILLSPLVLIVKIIQHLPKQNKRNLYFKYYDHRLSLIPRINLYPESRQLSIMWFKQTELFTFTS